MWLIHRVGRPRQDKVAAIRHHHHIAEIIQGQQVAIFSTASFFPPNNPAGADAWRCVIKLIHDGSGPGDALATTQVWRPIGFGHALGDHVPKGGTFAVVFRVTLQPDPLPRPYRQAVNKVTQELLMQAVKICSPVAAGFLKCQQGG